MKAYEQKASEQKESELDEAEILQTPIHDTGSMWYTILSFFLPILGLIGGFIFKKFKHMRNYKACLKGAIIGFSVIAAIIVIYLIFLLLALI